MDEGGDALAVVCLHIDELHAHPQLANRVADPSQCHDDGIALSQMESQFDTCAGWQGVARFDEHSSQAQIAGKGNGHQVPAIDLSGVRHAPDLAPVAGLVVDEAQNDFSMFGLDLGMNNDTGFEFGTAFGFGF